MGRKGGALGASWESLRTPGLAEARELSPGLAPTTGPHPTFMYCSILSTAMKYASNCEPFCTMVWKLDASWKEGNASGPMAAGGTQALNGPENFIAPPHPSGSQTKTVSYENGAAASGAP